MQMNTAQTCVKRVWQAKSRIIRPLFNVESPNFTWTSMPTWSAAIPDMTSLAAFGRHLLKFEKQQKVPPLMGLGRSFSGAVFRLAQPIGGFLV